MNRNRVLIASIVVSLGAAIVAAGLNTFFAIEAALVGFARLLALLSGLVLLVYVLVRGELSGSQRSGVGYMAGGTPIALSGATISTAGEFGLLGDLFGIISFVAGIAVFLYGATIVFDLEPISFVRPGTE